MKNRYPALAVVVALIGLGVLPSFAMLPASYDFLSAQSKREILWANIQDSEYTNQQALPEAGPGPLDLAKLLYLPFYFPTFLHGSDEMPLSRKRLIHALGTVAAVRFEAQKGHPFTGLFQNTSVGIARLSLAGAVNSPDSFVPGMALKLLIDGKPSVNFQVMWSLDGQQNDRNFFAHRFSNIVAPPVAPGLQAGSLVFAAFLKLLAHAPENERTLPLEEASAINPDGTSVSDWQAPFEVHFTPSSDVQGAMDPRDQTDTRLQLGRLAPGTTLYEVSARRRDSTRFFAVGRLILESRFVASKYGDQTIFFRHQRRLTNTP